MYYNQLLTTTALALLLSTLVSPVYADENTDSPVVTNSREDSLDSVQKGSIQIQMSNQETDEAMSGISFRISKVASIENGKYILVSIKILEWIFPVLRIQRMWNKP